MGESLAVNATAAKIRTLFGKMLTADNYREMLSKHSVAEVAEYLSETPLFSAAFKDVDPNTVHRGFLEALLNKSNFDLYLRLCRFQGLDKETFYSFLIQKRECEQLLNLVNELNSGLDRFVETLPGYVIRHSDLDLLKLSKAESYDDLLAMMKGSPYLKPLKSVRRTEDGGVDYTDCELKIRTFYYNRLIGQVRKKFSGKTKDELEKLIYSEIDVINIINAYRLKAYFGYTPAQIKATQLPFTRIGRRAMDRYYEADTPEDMIQRLKETVYGQKLSSDIGYIETEMNLSIYRLMRHTVACSASVPAVLYAFTRLCSIEVENIIHIIEGVRYGVEPSMLEKLLVV